MSESDLHKKIDSLEQRLQRLAKEKSQLMLLTEMLKNFENANNLDDVINTVINDALLLHGGQNVLLYYNINNKWIRRDMMGVEEAYNVDDDPYILKVIEDKKQFDLKGDETKFGSEFYISTGQVNIDTRTSFFPMLADDEVIAVLVLENRLNYNEQTMLEFELFFNYAGIVLKNAIRNYSTLDEVSNEFDQIFQQSSDGMLIINNDKEVVRINKSGLILLGMDKLEIVGKPIDAVRQINSPLSQMISLVQQGENNDFDVEITNSQSGEIAYCIGNMSVLKSKKDEIKGVICSFKNITDRKMAERRLQESEERFSMAIKGSNDGIWDWNLQTNEIFYSPRWKEMLGYQDHEIKNEFSEWERLVDSNGRREADKALKKIKRLENKLFKVEFRMRHKNGHWVHILSRAFLIEDTNGKPLRLVGTHTDLTESKEKQQQLKQALKKAEESDRMKSIFLANMSHEIRTPMNGIMGFSNMLLRNGLTEDKRQYYANVVMKSGDRLMRIVSDLLDISRLDVGHVQVESKKVNVNKLLAELYDEFGSNNSKTPVELTMNITLSDNDSVIRTDKSRLEQIVRNLLDNAFKFTHEGQIIFGYYQDGEKLIFYVEDTGIGIKKSFHKKIFESFGQVEQNVYRQYGGTGLGLTISQKLVELLGGKIDLESEEGKGSRFYFSIPYNPVNVLQNRDEARAKKDMMGNPFILVAEDEEINYLYLEEVLSSAGYNLIHAKNGLEAVEMFKSNSNIALVLMDIKLPLLNGLNATTQIKKMNESIPVIACTAYALETDKEKVLSAGCNDYLPKPVERQLLLAVVSKYMNRNM